MRNGRSLSGGKCNRTGRAVPCRRDYLKSVCASHDFPRESSAGGARLSLSQGSSAPTFLNVADWLHGCAVRQISTLALLHEPGSKSPREVSQRRPCVRSLHPSRMELAHGKVREQFNPKDSGAERE